MSKSNPIKIQLQNFQKNLILNGLLFLLFIVINLELKNLIQNLALWHNPIFSYLKSSLENYDFMDLD